MRGKNKIQGSYTIKNMYIDYIKDKIPGDPYCIPFKEYYDICADYYKLIVSQIIDKSRTVKLPFRLGHLYVGKKKPAILSGGLSVLSNPMNSLSIDWKETKKFGKWIHFINDHTGGYKYRFIWSKIDCFVMNKEFYRLVFTRSNKRYLAKVIKSGECDYLEI